MICLAALRWKLLNVSWQGLTGWHEGKHMQTSHAINLQWNLGADLCSSILHDSGICQDGRAQFGGWRAKHESPHVQFQFIYFSLLRKIVMQRRDLSLLAKLLDEHLSNSIKHSENQFGFMGWAISCHVDGHANIGDFNSILLPLALMRPRYSSYLGWAPLLFPRSPKSLSPWWCTEHLPFPHATRSELQTEFR